MRKTNFVDKMVAFVRVRDDKIREESHDGDDDDWRKHSTSERRLQRDWAQRTLRLHDSKRIFVITDEKNNESLISQQNNRVWATGRQADVDSSRLIVH